MPIVLYDQRCLEQRGKATLTSTYKVTRHPDTPIVLTWAKLLTGRTVSQDLQLPATPQSSSWDGIALYKGRSFSAQCSLTKTNGPEPVGRSDAANVGCEPVVSTEAVHAAWQPTVHWPRDLIPPAACPQHACCSTRDLESSSENNRGSNPHNTPVRLPRGLDW